MRGLKEEMPSFNRSSGCQHPSINLAKSDMMAPFDVEAILPESKAQKFISKLLESIEKVAPFPI